MHLYNKIEVAEIIDRALKSLCFSTHPLYSVYGLYKYMEFCGFSRHFRLIWMGLGVRLSCESHY